MSRRALVVDDEALNVMTLTDILELHGWDVTQAYHGSEAVEAVREQEFDVVLMDVRMPGMNGLQALREMRAHRSDMKVILMTAYSASDILQQAKEEGALRILSKPLDPGKVVELLEEAMGGVRPVLVVDDDPEFLSTLSDVLESAGYETLRAQTLEGAIQLLGRNTPFAVILDMRLDSLDPADVVDAIKRAMPSVIFILYSGYPELLEKARDSVPSQWVKGTLSKPFEPRELIELLEELTAE